MELNNVVFCLIFSLLLSTLSTEAGQRKRTKPKRYATSQVSDSPARKYKYNKSWAFLIPKDRDKKKSQIFESPRLEKRESQWLMSLGIPGQNGLFVAADEEIKSGRFLGWYEGQTFHSTRAMTAIVPALRLTGVEMRFSYFYDVRHPVTQAYLYSIDAFRLKAGQHEMSPVALINHKPEGLANAQFRVIKKSSAPERFAPAVFAIKNIDPGEEITVDYGEDFERTLQANSLSYRQFLTEHSPEKLEPLEDEKADVDEKEPSLAPQMLQLVFPLTQEVFSLPVADIDLSPLLLQVKEQEGPLDALFMGVPTIPMSDAQASDIMTELNYLIQHYESLCAILNEIESKEQLLFKVKNFQKLALVYWRLSLIHYAQELHAANPENQMSFLKARLVSGHQAFLYWSRAAALHLPVNAAFIEFDNVLKIFEVDPHTLIETELEIMLRQDILTRADEIHAFKDEADEIIREDAYPLKSMDFKIRDRQMAIAYYQSALYLAANHVEQDAEFSVLCGDLCWSLAESHHDDILNVPLAVRDYAQRALMYYQHAKKNKKKLTWSKSRDLKTDILVTQDLIGEILY